MNEHFDAVKDIPLRVMRVEGFVSCHFRVGMIAFHHVVVDDDRQRTANDLTVDNGHNLPFRKDVDQFLDLFTCPEHVFVRIDTGERLGQLGIVVHLKVADLYFVDFRNFIFHLYI